MPNYNDYINIECNGFKEQVILNEEGYTIGPESDGVTFVLFSYGYYPGEHVDKEAAKHIFSDIFSHGSSNVMCHNSIMELCVKGDRQIFKKCMEKRIETLRERIMRVSNRDRWRRAYENNLRNFIRLYESIKYECSAASQDKLVTKSSKELVNMIVFLMLQAKNPNSRYKNYEVMDPHDFIDKMNNPNYPVMTDNVLKEYLYEYSGKIPVEIQLFIDNKEALKQYEMTNILKLLDELQKDPTISTFLNDNNKSDLLAVTADPVGTIQSIVITIVNLHTQKQNDLQELLQRSGQEQAKLSADLKVAKSKQYNTSEINKLNADLAESRGVINALQVKLSDLKPKKEDIAKMKSEMANLERLLNETNAHIEQQRKAFEDEKTRSSSITSPLQMPSQVNEMRKKLDETIEQNRALAEQYKNIESVYSRVVQGQIGTAPVVPVAPLAAPVAPLAAPVAPVAPVVPAGQARMEAALKKKTITKPFKSAMRTSPKKTRVISKPTIIP